MNQEIDVLNIKVPTGAKLAIVGDIHEHENQFDRLIALIDPSPNMFFVSVGDIYDKGSGIKTANAILNKIRRLHDAGYGFIVKGNHELKHLRKAAYSNRWTYELDWINQQPLVLSFIFENGFRVTALHGGVKPSHTWNDLNKDTETSYIRNLDADGEMIKLKWNGKEYEPCKEGGIPWHEIYDGRFGYIVSGHEPLKNGKPRFYKYSCNIDTACYRTGVMTCQIISENGLEDLHCIKGVAHCAI